MVALDRGPQPKSVSLSAEGLDLLRSLLSQTEAFVWGEGETGLQSFDDADEEAQEILTSIEEVRGLLTAEPSAPQIGAVTVYSGQMDDWRLQDDPEGDDTPAPNPVTLAVKSNYGYGGLGVGVARNGEDASAEPPPEGAHQIALEMDREVLVLRVYTHVSDEPQFALNIHADGSVTPREI